MAHIEIIGSTGSIVWRNSFIYRATLKLHNVVIFYLSIWFDLELFIICLQKQNWKSYSEHAELWREIGRPMLLNHKKLWEDISRFYCFFFHVDWSMCFMLEFFLLI